MTKNNYSVSKILFIMFISCMSFSANASLVVYEDAGFITNQTNFTNSFEIEQSGNYQATLTDFNFPESVSNFGLAVTAATDITFGSIFNAGSFSFDATPGTYYVHLFGVAGGNLNLGLYGIQIDQLNMSAVPLPTSVVFLMSGLVILFAFGRGGRMKTAEDNMMLMPA